MIVKDEERFLPLSLSAARPFVDEIVVVDTGSTDQTLAIANSYGAKVFSVSWEHDFSKARNISISHATQDWIIVLDADEVITAQDFTALRKLIEERAHTLTGFKVLQRNYTADNSIANWVACEPSDLGAGMPGYFDSSLLRVFPRKEGILFRYRLHEDVLPSLREMHAAIVQTGIVIHHLGHTKSAAVMDKKRAIYRMICETSVAEDPSNAKAHFELGRMQREAGEVDLAADSFRKAVELKPGFAAAHAALGEALLKLGTLANSKKALEMALSLREDGDHVYSNLGIVLLRLGDKAGAEDAFKRGLFVHEASPRLHHNLVAFLLEQKRFKDALIALKQAHDATQMRKFQEIRADLCLKLRAYLRTLEKERTFTADLASFLIEMYTLMGEQLEAIRIIEQSQQLLGAVHDAQQKQFGKSKKPEPYG